jgi:hypothetical protein
MLTIISGGQTGVDQVALEVAHDLGFPTGGTAPLHYKTEFGSNYKLRDVYGLKESWSPGYRVRTIQNVKDGDFTVWFGDDSSPGARLTIDSAWRMNKPHRINPTVEQLLRLLTFEYAGILFLNVAGNRASTHPESWQMAEVILRQVLTAIRDGKAQ